MELQNIDKISSINLKMVDFYFAALTRISFKNAIVFTNK